MKKHTGFTAIFAVALIVGIVAMLAPCASAVTVTVNGTTAFDSGGFETETVGVPASSPTVGLGYQTVTQVNTVSDPPTISNVEVLDSTSGGPGANLGDNYLMLEKTSMINNRALGTIMALDAPAVPGDVVEANFAFYMDSTKTEIVDEAWDLTAFFPFVRDLTGFHGHHHTWFGFAAQSQYNLDLEWVDFTGAAADDMFLAYHDGTAWQQTMTAGGLPFFVNFDEWHDININLTVGQDYTVNIDGVTSAPMAVDSTAATPDVVGLQAMVNGSTAAAGFYIDDTESITTTPGDANLDGYVDVTDLGILATNYGTVGGALWGDADFTGDGNVNVSDLGILATYYGTVPPVQAVPEPSTICLILAAVGMFLIRRVIRKRNMRHLAALLVVGIAVSMLAVDAQAVQINNLTDSTTEFDSQGFENVAIGGSPMDSPAGGMIYRRIFGLANDDISVTGAAAGNPAAAEGDKYLMSNIDTPALGGQGSFLMGLENVAETSDNLVAEMALYVDSQGQPLDLGANGWASYPCFTFSRDYSGAHANNHTWLTYFPVGDWSSANFDTTGIGANQMIVGYHSVDAGGWKNVTTAGGTQNMYADIDAWQDVTFDLTVGSGFTIDIDGITSDMMAIDASRAADTVQSFRVFNNDSSATSRFYLDNISPPAASSIPEPGAIVLLLGGLAGLLMRRRH